MTGYGTGSATIGSYSVQVELQSVNSRYSEQRMRLSGILSIYEGRIKDRLKESVRRGDVSVKVELSTGDEQPFRLELNKKVILAYVGILSDLEKEGVMTSPVTLRDVLTIDDSLRKVPDEKAVEMIGRVLDEALDNAIEKLLEMQRLEGENLHNDIMAGIDKIEIATKQIEKEEKALPRKVELKLEEIGKHLSSKLPEDRVAQEVALALARMDIHEEIVRLKSHIEQFQSAVLLEPPLGTKLNFIIQEMHREANTIASKAQASEIVRQVIDIKEQTERIREQLRNVQ